MSVYLSVASPDRFSKWGEGERERWLKDHHRGLSPIFEQLVNERPLTAQQAEDFRDALDLARDEESAISQKRGIYFGNV